MGDVRGEAVPKHKLTKEQLGFQKKFGNLLKVKFLLDSKALTLKNEMKEVQELYKGLGMSFSSLKPPEEGTKELEGMDFGEENPNPDEQLQR